jgi:hypothetical protein
MNLKTTCETIEDDTNKNINPLPNNSTIILDLACNIEAYPTIVKSDNLEPDTVNNEEPTIPATAESDNPEPTTVNTATTTATQPAAEPVTSTTATYPLKAMSDPSVKRELSGSARLLWQLWSDESAAQRLSLITTWAHTSCCLEITQPMVKALLSCNFAAGEHLLDNLKWPQH